LVVLALLVALPWLGTRVVAERTVEDRWAILGTYLGARHPGSLLAIDAAGKVPFFSGLTTIDMYGLNDSRIAHEPSAFSAPGHSKSLPGYVLARRPDLIAGWLDPATLMINPGLTRDAYSRAGYRLDMLFYTPKGGHPSDRGPELIVPTGGLTPREVRDYWGRGYRYGILARPRGNSSDAS
jgi:arabinofuranosyltransferase